MEMPSILKYIFLIHFIVSIIFGVLFFLSPEFYRDLTAWPFFDPTTGRVMGSGFLAFAITSLFGYMATSWEEVRIIVLGEIVFTLFSLVAMVWMMAVYATIPLLAGVFNTSLFAIFFILFLYSYYIATR
ncbi:MAG: hypothetical protein ACFFEX_19210 [Candidatus Thorarchaeota archaeon]